MKKVLAVLLVMVLVLGACVTVAENAPMFSFEQIVGMVDAIRIDGEVILTDGAYVDSSTLPSESPYSQIGATFVWMTDESKGILQVSGADNAEQFYQWNCSDLSQVSAVLEVLDTIIPDNGGEVTFAIATQEDFYNPSLIYKYGSSEQNDSEAEYYDDSDKFCNAAQEALNALTVTDKGEASGADAEVPTLSKGSKGDDVKKLQNRLNELGYSVGEADGIYGKKTESGVSAFQELNGLKVTGVADSDTQLKLYSNDAVKPTTKPTIKPTQKPSKSSSSSSSSSSLLSKSDCEDLARFYLQNMVGSATISLIDASMDGDYCLVAIQYFAGGSTRVSGFLIDRRDGSLVYVQ